MSRIGAREIIVGHQGIEAPEADPQHPVAQLLLAQCEGDGPGQEERHLLLPIAQGRDDHVHEDAPLQVVEQASFLDGGQQEDRMLLEAEGLLLGDTRSRTSRP